MNIAVICVFSLLILSQLPWWMIVITSSIAGLLSKGWFSSILNGFLCGSLPWVTMFLYRYNFGAELLVNRISAMIGVEHWSGALFATLMIGGICGILGSLCSYSFRKAFRDQLINP